MMRNMSRFARAYAPRYLENENAYGLWVIYADIAQEVERLPKSSMSQVRALLSALSL